MNDQSSSAPLATYIPFEEFQQGLPQGRFRVIINPELAKPFVLRIGNVMPVTLAMVGCGLATAISGYMIAGTCVIALGALFRRLMGSNAPQILLYLASRQSRTYHLATEHAIMEVRRA